MQNNPVEEWQRLTEHYREMFDGELEELAHELGNLTETAQQVLRNEMKNRGLAMPGEKTEAPQKPEAAAPSRFASAIDPDAGSEESDDPESDQEGDSPTEFTWKTPLCECEDQTQALAICEALRRAGIDGWFERSGSRMGISGPRVVVAADQLDEAREIVSKPATQQIIDEYREDVPEYAPPKCPSCGAPDPVLESVEPTNSWLCEACGKQWADPADTPE